MRAVVLLAVLALAGIAQAGFESGSASTPTTCASDGAGQTCARSASTRTGYRTDDGTGRVHLTDDRRWSWGNHSSDTPNTWNSSRRTLGVAGVVAGHSVSAGIAFREYTASEEADGRTRRTTDNGVEVVAASSDAPAAPPLVGFTDRRVEGGYHHCIVSFAGTPLLAIPCGPGILEEAVLP